MDVQKNSRHRVNDILFVHSSFVSNSSLTRSLLLLVFIISSLLITLLELYQIPSITTRHLMSDRYISIPLQAQYNKGE